MEFPVKPLIDTICIQPVNGGYSVSVGCESFFFASVVRLLDDLQEYMLNPRMITRRFQEQDPTRKTGRTHLTGLNEVMQEVGCATPAQEIERKVPFAER